MSRDLALSKDGFAFTAVKQSNALPHDVKIADNFRVFKRKLKECMSSALGISLSPLRHAGSRVPGWIISIMCYEDTTDDIQSM